MSNGMLDRDLGGIQAILVEEPADWKTRAAMYKTIAEARLREIERQDVEIGELRRQVAALRAVTK